VHKTLQAMLAVACILAAVPALALPPEPPAKVYVPGNQKKFQKGVDAYDAGDYKRAFEIFSDLADNDDIAALRNVALMERKGLGTPRDVKAAIRDYKKAAEAGLPTAAADLGQMLYDGETGPRDPKAALPWLKIAAAASHPVAQFLLAQMYEYGEGGLKQNYDKAEKLYAAAAAHGDIRALYRLSYLKGWPAPNRTPPPDRSARNTQQDGNP
jgi:TPR repeat protein